jgi:hypothetical protein
LMLLTGLLQAASVRSHDPRSGSPGERAERNEPKQSDYSE